MFFGVKNSRCGQRGYTLIDLAMALTILGLLLSGVATGARVYLKDKQLAQTREYTRIVANAIENYVLEKGRLPCPAGINTAMTSNKYGREQTCSSYNSATTKVDTMVTPGAFDATKGLWGEVSEDANDRFVVRGMVPFADLNLPEFYAYDGFGNRLQYAVSTDLTDAQGFINAGGKGAITVADSGGSGAANSARHANHYLVFSSGPSEEGAWSRYGVQIKACGTGLDSENCNTLTDNKAKYMSARYSLANSNQKFDDIMQVRSTKHMPMWKPTDDADSANGEDIRTVDDDKRLMISTAASGGSVALPSNADAAALKVDVDGSTGANKVMGNNYCDYDDAGKCFTTNELLNSVAGDFVCGSGFIRSVQDGKVTCVAGGDFTRLCANYSTANPQYVVGLDTNGELICRSYSFTPDAPSGVTLGVCGTAHLTTRATAPSTNAELCSVGAPGAVTAPAGQNWWEWTCANTGGNGSTDCMAFKTVNPVNGVCGPKSGTSVTSAPTDPGLCNTGSTGTVSGTGPWSWVCGGQNGGTNAGCYTNWKRNAVCGSANGVTYASAPTTNLCEVGSASAVAGANPYTWTCSGENGGSNASCATGAPTTVNGACGTSNGQSFYTAPSASLCSTGTPTVVSGSGPWTWNCSGAGIPTGTSASCSANKKTDGVCGSANGVTVASPPSSNLCSAGNASAVGGPNPYTWTCNGINGGTTASCASGAPTTVNGACGSANGVYVSSAPSTNLCGSGSASGVTNGASAYTWTCSGSGIPLGTTASCSAPKATTSNGACASYGSYYASQPATSTANGCTGGVYADAGDTASLWQWNCNGSGTPVGTNVSCSANKATTVNGVCGSSNGGTYTSPPSSNLCSAGGATAVTTGASTYTWSCNGGGTPAGTTANCSATKATIVNGSCGGSNNTCSAGTASGYNAGSCGGNATWSCVGANGGSTASCSNANAACAVNGSCGASANTCSAGSPSGYSAGSCGGSATWTCNGSGGGSNASCSKANAACVVNGSCGASNNTCNAGTATSYNAGSCGGSATWTCAGSGGGSNASCSKANAACPVNGVCGATAATCDAGTVTSDNGSTACDTTRTWSCAGANGGSTASCSLANAACGGGGGGCFIGTTKVAMADGGHKPIASLKIGDEVKGQGGEVNKVVRNTPFYVKSELYRINGSKDAYVTANHPFYTKDGWKAIDVEGARKDHPGVDVTQLKIGDILVDVNGNEVELKSMEPEDHGWLTVYNPSMNGNHTYYANDLLMHNLKCVDCGGGGCFTGTTKVLMADGSYKDIVNLKKGDMLKGHTQNNAVVSNLPYYVRSILYRINGSKDAYVTANHPFYTKDGWKAFDVVLANKDHPGLNITQLKRGDVLLNSKGEEVVLETFEQEDHGWLIVYNPHLDGDHTYYANDLLMHNPSDTQIK